MVTRWPSLRNRTHLTCYQLERPKQVRTVLDGKYLYSYSDGDQAFPMVARQQVVLGRLHLVGGWNNTDIALVKADGSGEVTNPTESGYSDDAKWVLDGKAP